MKKISFLYILILILTHSFLLSACQSTGTAPVNNNPTVPFSESDILETDATLEEEPTVNSDPTIPSTHNVEEPIEPSSDILSNEERGVPDDLVSLDALNYILSEFNPLTHISTSVSKIEHTVDTTLHRDTITAYVDYEYNYAVITEVIFLTYQYDKTTDIWTLLADYNTYQHGSIKLKESILEETFSGTTEGGVFSPHYDINYELTILESDLDQGWLSIYYEVYSYGSENFYDGTIQLGYYGPSTEFVIDERIVIKLSSSRGLYVDYDEHAYENGYR